jgi:hypothetical protein
MKGLLRGSGIEMKEKKQTKGTASQGKGRGVVHIGARK